MKQLINACYGSNFDNYDHLACLLNRLEFAGIGVELSLFSDKPDYTERLLSQKERFRPYYITLHGPFMELEATSPVGSKRYCEMMGAMNESFKIYKHFHAHSIVIHTNQCRSTPESKLDLMHNSLVTLQEIAKRAQEGQVMLLVENVGESIHGNMLFDQEEFITLFDSLPGSVGCLLDIGHAILNDWDFKRVIGALKNRISAYHLHNNDGTGDTHRPLFESNMKYSPAQLQELFDLMERDTPDADWILEYAPGSHITADLMEADVKRLLQMVNKTAAC